MKIQVQDQIIYTATASDLADNVVVSPINFSLFYSAPSIAGSSYQSVYVSESQIQENGENQSNLKLKITYQSDVEVASGLDLRIHFNSSELSFDSISSALANEVDTAGIGATQISNTDENAATDSYVDISWSAFSGPVETELLVTEALAELSFTIEAGFNQETTISFSSEMTNQAVSFESSENLVGALQIDSTSGKVKLTADPDHEAQEQYVFDVIATDGAGNSSQPKTVTLDINDLDDIAPVFVSPTKFGLPEDSTDKDSDGNHVIYRVEVDDSGDTKTVEVNGEPTTVIVEDKIEYSLLYGDLLADGIEIDKQTGVVTLDKEYDLVYGVEPYTFTVLAQNYTLIDDAQADEESNREYTPNTGVVQNVTVNVLNAIDSVPPKFDSELAIATPINENSGAEQVVYTAFADDSADISAGVTFSLAGIDAAAFAINEDSGEVTLIADPDHETQSEYSFTVVASDGVNDAVEQTVTLDINNLDEQDPVINQLAVDETLSVEENIVDQLVYTVTATDDSNADRTFALTDSSDSGFSINSVTGEVRLNSSPNFEVKTSYSFEVVAFDQAGNESTPQQFTVSVNNSDEIAPTITSGATGIAVDENSGTDQIVYTATADDSDFVSAGVIFSLADEALGFSIDATTGVVTTNADFAADYESAESKIFTVVATDDALNFSDQLVSVAINNLDETAPTIIPA
jgi:acyl-coenzyme A thioesterase PaaI-like protein